MSHSGDGRDRHASRVLRYVFPLLMLLIGTAIFLYPTVTAWIGQQEVDQRLEAALGDTQATGGGSAATGGAAQSAAKKRDKATDPAYQYLLAYNQQVAAGTAGAINDPWGIGSDPGELAKAGLADGIVGSLTVPAMGVHLPIYLGASSENMANGAAMVSGTSAPLGDAGDTAGAGSNCVIAGHRGVWRGVPIFRDIEDIKLGDTLSVDTPWDTLTYRAVQIKIVDPSDVGAVRVQPGRDLITLLTCHPYGHNSQRYLVFFERAADAPVEAPQTGMAGFLRSNPVAEALKDSDSPQLVAERWLRVLGLGIIAATALFMVRRALRALMRLISHH